MNRLENKIALITGASDGIGFKVSEAFAREGASVAMLARGEEKLAAAAESLSVQGFETLPLPCDVGSSEQMQAAFATVLKRYGRIDVLVNNAAVAIPGDITEDSDEAWNKLLNINLLGVFRGIKYALPSMLQQGKGSIINMASVQGDRSWDHWTTYAAAKGAIKAATRQLAGQYGKQGVRFNTVSPGAIDTPMNQKRAETEGPELYQMYQRMHALGRMGEADEVNGACVFLASDESSFVTGIDLTVGGGLEIALACDMMVAAEDAVMGLPEILLNLIPGGGGTQRLAAKVGQNRANEILMSGRNLTALEAQQWGLVSQLYPRDGFEQKALEFARGFTDKNPDALRVLKQLTQIGAGGPMNSAAQCLENEALQRFYHSDAGQAKIQEFYQASLERERKRAEAADSKS